LAVLVEQLLACPSRPAGDAVLEHGRPFEEAGGLVPDRLPTSLVEEFAAVEQGEHVSDRAGRRRQAARGLAVQPLGPETVLVTPPPDRLGTLAPRVRPPLLAGPAVQLARGEHRARRAPHHGVRLVVDVLADELEELVGPGV